MRISEAGVGKSDSGRVARVFEGLRLFFSLPRSPYVVHAEYLRKREGYWREELLRAYEPDSEERRRLRHRLLMRGKLRVVRDAE